MPKDTFFRLNQEKRGRILEAARIEFSKHPLKDASIAEIIRLADVPRGSFYQYFEDKEDLYFYYFDQLRKDRSEELIAAIKTADGDLFSGYDHYFSAFISDLFSGEDAAFYRNLFLHMDYRASRKVTEGQSRHTHQHKVIPELLLVINKAPLKVENDEQLAVLIRYLMNMFFTTIGQGYHERMKDPDYPIERIVTNLKLGLSWLREGAYRKDGE